MLCTLVVSQMLPDSVVIKGGMGVKLRFGELGTRATADLDVCTASRGAIFEEEFQIRAARGWGRVPPSQGELSRNPNAADRVAFTAQIRATRTHDPGLPRPQYVTHPYRISIIFLGKQWSRLEVEVSDPEIDAHAFRRRAIDYGLLRFNDYFGFGALEPVELVDLEYQIAQKIHAVSDPLYQRAHDLVDLQLLWAANPDKQILLDLCLRTFTWRDQQPWPPLPLREMSHWELAYQEAREETIVNGNTSVLPDVKAAREWLGRVIMLVASSS